MVVASSAVINVAVAGDIRKLTRMLKGKEHVVRKTANAMDSVHRTALNWACAHGRTSCAELLLEKGADPNLADKFGYTALHEASNFCHLGCVKLLLENRANPNAANRMGETPLHLACQKDPKVTALLLKHRAAQYLYCMRGLPIHVACHFGDAPCVKELLRAANDRDLDLAEFARWKGMTAWQYAQYEQTEEHEACCRALEKVLPNTPNVGSAIKGSTAAKGRYAEFD